jgi:hypothetical protein
MSDEYTDDQGELLDACEQVAILPPDVPLDDVEEAFDRALTLMEADHGGKLIDKDLFRYRDRFAAAGREIAAGGVQRMIDRLAGEIAYGSAGN